MNRTEEIMKNLDIDPGIRTLIERLWDHGYHTLFSCQGHRPSPTKPEGSLRYVSYQEGTGDGWFEEIAFLMGFVGFNKTKTKDPLTEKEITIISWYSRDIELENIRNFLLNKEREPKKCGAPWGCNNLTSKSQSGTKRTVGGVEVCRSCYQYVWDNTLEQPPNFKGLKGPSRITKANTPCSRKGCTVKLHKTTPCKEYRRIGNKPVCRACYQAAWEKSKAEGISLEEAYKKLPPRKPRRKKVYKNK